MRMVDTKKMKRKKDVGSSRCMHELANRCAEPLSEQSDKHAAEQVPLLASHIPPPPCSEQVSVHVHCMWAEVASSRWNDVSVCWTGAFSGRQCAGGHHHTNTRSRARSRDRHCEATRIHTHHTRTDSMNAMSGLNAITSDNSVSLRNWRGRKRGAEGGVDEEKLGPYTENPIAFRPLPLTHTHEKPQEHKWSTHLIQATNVLGTTTLVTHLFRSLYAHAHTRCIQRAESELQSVAGCMLLDRGEGERNGIRRSSTYLHQCALCPPHC